METLKTIHVTFVALSFAGFFIRGIWMLRGSPVLQQRWVKITPQLVDTVLLVSAIILAVQLRFSPMEQPWLMAKIIALLAYIGWTGCIAIWPNQTYPSDCLAAWPGHLPLYCFGRTE